MLGAVAATEAVDPVFLAKDLRDVAGDRINDGLDAGLVQAIAECPFGDGMGIKERVGTDLGLLALDVFFDGIRITRHVPLL